MGPDRVQLPPDQDRERQGAATRLQLVIVCSLPDGATQARGEDAQALRGTSVPRSAALA